MEDPRLAKALEEADLAFWASIGDSYPEITTGDLDAGSVIDFNQAAETAVKQWLYYNAESKLTNQELATVLAALRFWQDNVDDEEKKEMNGYGHFLNHAPLTNEDVNDLCEKVNIDA